MKKIKYEELAYICNYKKNHPLEKYFCNWYISLNNPNEGYLRCDQKLWFYILTFIPVHVLAFLYCIWDSGIKNFELQPITIHGYNCVGCTNESNNTRFGRLVEIWNKYNK